MKAETNVSVYNPLNSSVSFNYRWYVTGSLSFNILLGLPANCYVMWLSMREMIRGQSPEIFVFNAALVEVIFCLSSHFYIRLYFMNCTECFAPATFLGLILFVGRPVFMSCICVERYLGVLHPVTFLKFRPMKYRITCSVVAWIVIFSSCSLVVTNFVGMYDLLLSEYLVVLSVKLYSCLMVLKALRSPGPSDDTKKREVTNQDKIRAFRIIQITLVSGVILYGPATVSLILYHIIDVERFLVSWCTVLCLGVISGFVPPFLYLRKAGKLPFC